METINKEFFHTKDAEVKKKKSKLPTLEAIIQGRKDVIKDRGTNKPSIPNNMIRYEAPAKLAETTSNKSSGLHTNAFNTTIKSHTFENGVGIIEFEGNVTSIDNRAFYNCSNLTSVTIPNSVTSIGSYAFANCGLANVIIPDSVTSIGEGAFNGCSGLASATIGNNVTSIGDGAFSGCNSLTNITIPNSIISIGNGAFYGCSNLSTITSHIMNAPSVNSGTFGDVKSGGTLYVPIGSSGYDTWMNNQGNLGYHNWTKIEQ